VRSIGGHGSLSTR